MEERSIFKRIINWFKNIFKKPNRKQISENSYVQQEQQKVDDSIGYKEEYKEETVNTNELNESEKEKFFSLYNDVKSKKINVEDLSTEDLKKFNAMIREEVVLKQKKLDNINQENARIEEKINELNKKNNYSSEGQSGN